MKYIGVSFLVLLSIEIYGAESDQREIMFTKSSTGAATFDVTNSLICLICVDNRSSGSSMHFAQVPIQEGKSLLMIAGQILKKMREDSDNARVFCMTIFPNAQCSAFKKEAGLLNAFRMTHSVSAGCRLDVSFRDGKGRYTLEAFEEQEF